MNAPTVNEAPRPASAYDKARKVGQYARAYKNFLTCLRLRQRVGNPTGETQTVEFRNGLRMNVRVGTPDISILWEVLIGGAYASTEALIRAAGRPCSVLDLGANIGAFTLRCAGAPGAHVHSYEPGPQNAAILRSSLDLNPALSPQVKFYEEAVARESGVAFWRFDAGNPGGSALTASAEGLEVKTCSFRDALQRCIHPIALVKIDIEGSEYALLEGTEKADWDRVPAVLTELHPDPSGTSSPDAWLKTMADFGFRRQQREYSSLLLRR